MFRVCGFGVLFCHNYLAFLLAVVLGFHLLVSSVGFFLFPNLTSATSFCSTGRHRNLFQLVTSCGYISTCVQSSCCMTSFGRLSPRLEEVL